MSDRDPKYVVGDRPVNRRTAPRPAAPPKVSAAATERVRLAQVRSRIGAPLGEQLRARPGAAHGAVSAGSVAGGMLATAGALGLFFAWLHASPLGGVTALAGVGAGLFLALRRGGTAPAVLQPEARALLDPAAVAAFDDALERIAAELPAHVASALADLKQLVLRIARHPAAGNVDEHFRSEDRFYVNECLRRYLPDSLQAYFAVPAAQRAASLPDGHTPESLLLEQLALLRGELARREEALARSASEALLRQQRFLKAKAGDQRRL